MSQQEQQPAGSPGQVQVKISDEILRGVYANMVQIGHGSEEFILDFMSLFPPSGTVNARVIVSPSHFKRIVKAMEDNLKQYEQKFGTISLAVVPDQQIGFKTE